MAEKATFHMKSGNEYTVYLDPNDLSPDEVASQWYDSVIRSKMTTLRINSKILILSEVEAITFE